MTDQPLVSVIIPVYNAEELVGKTLESVLNQTYRNIEILAINDGSNDGSGRVLDGYTEKDDRLKVHHIENGGQCAASNHGLKYARGKYIKFIDADDLMNPEHIEMMLGRMEDSEEHLVSCEWGRFYDGNPDSTKFIPEPVWKDMDPLDWIVTSLSQKADMVAAWVWLIPRKLLDESGHWNEKLSLINDFDFSLRLISNCKGIRFAEGAKVYYRSGQEGNLAGSSSRKAYESSFLSTQLGSSAILKREHSERTRKVFADRFQYWAYQYYPWHMDLYRAALNESKKLGGSKLPMPAGPKYKLLIGLLGWKMAKRIYIRFT